jgi:hypothetical protein
MTASMSAFRKITLSTARSALRVAMVVTLMTGPVYAVSAMKDRSISHISGAGLVLYVSLERA